MESTRTRLIATRTLLVLLVTALLHASPANATRGGDIGVLLDSMNAARMSEHLAPLRLDRRLTSVAYEHALDMERRNYFEHQTPEGETPFARMRAEHIRFAYAGENLAVDESAETIFDDFWNSSEHRQNMLGRHYVRVGIASIEASVGTIVVEDFSD